MNAAGSTNTASGAVGGSVPAVMLHPPAAALRSINRKSGRVTKDYASDVASSAADTHANAVEDKSSHHSSSGIPNVAASGATATDLRVYAGSSTVHAVSGAGGRSLLNPPLSPLLEEPSASSSTSPAHVHSGRSHKVAARTSSSFIMSADDWKDTPPMQLPLVSNAAALAETSLLEAEEDLEDSDQGDVDDAGDDGAARNVANDDDEFMLGMQEGQSNILV